MLLDKKIHRNPLNFNLKEKSVLYTITKSIWKICRSWSKRVMAGRGVKWKWVILYQDHRPIMNSDVHLNHNLWNSLQKRIKVQSFEKRPDVHRLFSGPLMSSTKWIIAKTKLALARSTVPIWPTLTWTQISDQKRLLCKGLLEIQSIKSLMFPNWKIQLPRKKTIN